MTAVMADAAERTFSTVEIAGQLSVTPTTVWRWACSLGYGGEGHGIAGAIRLTATDVLILRAWAQLENKSVHGEAATRMRQLRSLVADAIRRRPAPIVVVLGPDRACTVDTWEAGVTLAMALGRGHVRWVIDLEGPA